MIIVHPDMARQLIGEQLCVITILGEINMFHGENRLDIDYQGKLVPT